MGTETIHLEDDAATAALGARLAAELSPGAIVLLEGGLGAGKTALARAMIRALVGDEGIDVPSPSFALVQPYDARGIPVLHADLYRLHEAREIDELGLLDLSDGIVIVEWPERAPELATRATLKVGLDIPAGGMGRTAVVTR